MGEIRLTVYLLLIDRFLSQLLLILRERLFAIEVDLQCWVWGRREEGEDALVFLWEGLWFTPPSGQLVDIDDCGVCVFDCHFGGVVFDYEGVGLSGGKVGRQWFLSDSRLATEDTPISNRPLTPTRFLIDKRTPTPR